MEQKIKEGFPRQRLVVVPASVHSRCHKLPMLGQLHITHIGNFPSAPHHFIERKEGVPQVILIYCLKGTGWLEMAGATFRIDKGHAVLISPDVPHIYRADGDDPWSVFWIHFDGEQVSLILESLGVTDKKPLIYVPDTEMMRQTFEDVFACLNYHYSDAGLLAMTSELMRLISRIKLNQGNPRKEMQADEDRIMESIRFMERHLDMTLTLESLASRAGQSVPHYCKLFKERIGQPPLAHFIQLKINKACELLFQTNQTVKAIAEQLGYDDPYYFSRQFKKVQGLSPSEYRESISSGENRLERMK